MRLHVVGLAHTETTKAWEFCAFTARTRVFASMMTARGYDVRLYAGEANEARVTEHVPLTTRTEQRAWWPAYDGTSVFNEFDSGSRPWRLFNARAAAAIAERSEPGDVLCLTMGLTHKPIADALRDAGLTVVEPGIGYSGIWAPFRVFESAAWMHFLAAREPTDTVRFFDAVIPRPWELEDFPAGTGAGGYYLFMGRLTARKGPAIAAETARRIGARLLVAGQGVASTEPGVIVCQDGTRLEGDVEYVGTVGPAERAALMGGAAATFTPTLYLEPGGGVAIESMLTGTPVIATDYGCFRETVDHGRSGFRARTLAEFVAGAKAAPALDRDAVRRHALRWTTPVVGAEFDAYFQRLDTLRGDGWYAITA